MSSPVTVTEPVSTHQRWGFLDVLRGFAILGILLVNAIDMTNLGMGNLLPNYGGLPPDPVRDALYLTVQTRFVPIFVFLFGISLWIVLDGARARVRHAWLVMVRRLVAVALIGWLLAQVYPGNVLVEYGVFGLVMLPVVALLPRWATLGGGVILTVGTYVVFGGGIASLPGLILLGAGAAAYGLPRLLDAAGKPVTIVFAVAAVLTVPALIWQMTTPGDPRFSTPGGIAGLVMAVLYTTGLALLWRTPARKLLSAVFEPLGRMALTNYITGAVAIAGAALLVDFEHMSGAAPLVLLSLGVIAVQSVLSRLWLSRFVYGPVEWLWRVVTWWRPVAIRRLR